MTDEPREQSYTTAGRHRREIGSGQIRFELRRAWAELDIAAPEVQLNGFPLRLDYGDSVVRVPAGPMRVDVSCPWVRQSRGAVVDFVLGEGYCVDVRFTVPRFGFGPGRLDVVAVSAPTLR